MDDTRQILHLTDCHLLADREGKLHGWSVAAAFECVLAHALDRYPETDAIVLGGDLVDDESDAGYHWLNDVLATTARPVLAIAGNHDDPQAMARRLDSAVVHDQLCLGGWRLIGLCSHRPGHEDGLIGSAALHDLEARLAADRSPTLVCVHHPPFAVGSAWIDAMGLNDGPALRAVLARHAHVRGVLAGHVHQASQHRLEHSLGWTTPATMRQFLPGSPDFAEDPTRPPGYRWLALEADGRITTTVHRCPMVQGPERRGTD
ncbi:metallophosphoesterase [Salinisphaera sp. SPP-AMP-43]|uniref:metallophosphoesterase n=1 Tax=Salinisphaera sp. SPP-AMP-43 TaxID=3121288 RepID=UPI003C6DB8A7